MEPTNAKQQHIFRDVIIFGLWLILGAALTIFFMMLIVSLVFHANSMPHQAGILLYVVFWFITYLRLNKNGMTFADIWLNCKINSYMYSAIGFLIGAVFISVIFGILVAAGLINYKTNILSKSLILVLLVSLGFTLIQSGTEELLFRGYLLRVLSKKSRFFAIIVTSTLFSILHFYQGVNPIGWLNIFLFGILTAQMVFIWKTLWMPMGFHAGWNFFQHDIFTFSVYGWTRPGLLDLNYVPGSDTISGGSYGPEGSLITTVLLLLFVSLAALLERRTILI